MRYASSTTKYASVALIIRHRRLLSVGDVVGQGGGDLQPSIEALEAVLQQALKLARPIHYLDVAIQCLQCVASSGKTSEACAKTMLGYFPSARFEKAIKHYMCELKRCQALRIVAT